MNHRLLIIITVIIFVIELSFSLYYSGEIIIQNTIFETNTSRFELLQTTNQQLTLKLASLTSVNHLSSQITPNLQPIRSTLDLSND